MTEEVEYILKQWVKYWEKVFGPEFISYNVHSIIDLPSECRLHGALDDSSTFKYEHNMQLIKISLRSCYKPLQQLANRKQNVNVNRQNLCAEVVLKKQTDPLETLEGGQYKMLTLKNVTFTLDNGNRCFKSTAGEVVIIKNIVCIASKKNQKEE